jgi:hypothetical protein
MTLVGPAHQFCAHESNTLGVQALGILHRYGVETLLISGGDPAVPLGATLVITLDNSFAYIQLSPASLLTYSVMRTWQAICGGCLEHSLSL